ncbi:MAG: hypothetical protein ACM3NQ_22480, partial [Bacteroidales bacterium]
MIPVASLPADSRNAPQQEEGTADFRRFSQIFWVGLTADFRRFSQIFWVGLTADIHRLSGFCFASATPIIDMLYRNIVV